MSVTQSTSQKTPTCVPVYKREDSIWHIEISRASNGNAIVNRIRGAKPTRPAIWTSDRTPEEWISIQRHPSKYVPINQGNN